MAQSATDPLRRTLDTYEVPKETADRPYLESVLRRLGYSEAEIRAYLGDKDEGATPAAVPDTEDRLVEVEYTGPGLREFKLAQAVSLEEFEKAQRDSGPAIEMESGPSMEEVERALAEGNLVDDFGDFTPTETPPIPEEGEGGPGGFDEAGEPVPMEGAEGEGGAPVEGADALEALEGEAVPAEDVTQGEPLVEFSATDLSEAEVEPVNVESEAERLIQEGWDVDSGTGDFAQGEPVTDDEPEVTLGPDDVFRYNDWTLYRKDEEEGPNPQSIYFFSKSQPEGAVPSPIPEGYEVAENPETGRPFLRRMTDDSQWTDPGSIESASPGWAANTTPGKKRVRIVKVRAASREEAMKKMSSEGRSIVGSLAIDVERTVEE